MPIRTSSLVAGGMVLLTVVGVTTIFGNTIVAMIAPPPSAPEPTKVDDRPGPAGDPSAIQKAAHGARPVSVVTRDAGVASPDTKS